MNDESNKTDPDIIVEAIKKVVKLEILYFPVVIQINDGIPSLISDSNGNVWQEDEDGKFIQKL